ncbi:hypothetical protein [Mycobacterium kiyosense]|uniref:hypothetical protein n=1 Tax=Mycobacterium kiyosense TaxID=2871094 RepID=UPI0022326F86|nr:hypothetical protein [Mycobacterium kiyosense]
MAVLVVVVVLVGGLWVWRSGVLGASKGPGNAQAQRPWVPPIGTPQELLVSFSLDRQPVAGWQVRPTDVGLPDYAPIGNLFASDGDRAYFLSEFHDNDCGNACRPPQAWVYGIDTTTGKKLFDPVVLPRWGVTCYGNGPGVAVCLAEIKPPTASVIDLVHGVLSFTGPTDVAVSAFPGPEAHAVGTYLGQSWLVASVNGRGVYGVGSHGERTWFVPGTGYFNPTDARVADDIPAPVLAVSPSGLNDVADRVFSPADGHEVTPAAPAGTSLTRAVVYNGGFAYAYREGQTGQNGVMFYDVSGKVLAQRPMGPSTVKLLDNPAMPVVAVDGQWQVFTAVGKPVTEIAAPEMVPILRMIGSKLYVQRGDVIDHAWQQWDLHTGQSGATCAGQNLEETAPSGEYVASDGTTVIGKTGGVFVGQYAAMNRTTCQILWKTPADVRVNLWKVGTGLLQSDQTHNAMTWLRPPA